MYIYTRVYVFKALKKQKHCAQSWIVFYIPLLPSRVTAVIHQSLLNHVHCILFPDIYLHVLFHYIHKYSLIVTRPSGWHLTSGSFKLFYLTSLTLSPKHLTGTFSAVSRRTSKSLIKNKMVFSIFTNCNGLVVTYFSLLCIMKSFKMLLKLWSLY